MSIPYFDRNPPKGTAQNFEDINLHIQSYQRKSKADDVSLLVEAATSRFIDREPPVGTKFATFDNLYIVDKTFTKGGAYISLLLPTKSEQPPLLVCRGMAFRRSATSGIMSGLNGLSINFGFLGAYSNYEDISDYLKDKKIETVNILGKSLGGAHAQYLSLLLPQKVDKLYTLASPGIGLDLKKAEVTVVIREEGDGVHLVGGKHLEGKNATHIYSIKPKEDSWVDDNESQWNKFVRFFKSFSGAHIRQTTLKDFDVKECPKTSLLFGETFEKIRKVIAWIFTLITFGAFSPPRFESVFPQTESGQALLNPLQQALEPS